MIEELHKVISYAKKEAEIACVHHRPYYHLEEITDRLQSIIDQMKAEERAIVEEVNKRWPTGKPQPDDTFVGAAPPVPDGMVLVPEVLLRQISKWLAESADPYDKAAYAINGLIAAAKEVAGGASDVERVVRPCNSCGSTRYEIQHLYTGYHEKLIIVQCGYCKDRIIPVVVDYFMPQQEVYAKCETAWNGANAVPNEQK